MSYKKLVRDNIPNIIKESGNTPIIRILSDDEYKIELEKKLMEECNEVLESSNENRIEELADLLEVIISLAKIENKEFKDIEEICKLKRLKRGSLNKKIYLEGVK